MSKDLSHEDGQRTGATDAWNQMMVDTWARALNAHRGPEAVEAPTNTVVDATSERESISTPDRKAVFDQALGELLTAPLIPEGGWNINDLRARANELADERLSNTVDPSGN